MSFLQFVVTGATMRPSVFGGLMGSNQFTDNNVAHLDVPNESGVYLITDTITGKTYIGSSTKIRTRITTHFFDMKRRPNSRTYRTFAKTFEAFGPKVFCVSVLEFCDKAALQDTERKWVARLQPTENSYLCVDGRPVYSAGSIAAKSAAAARLWKDPDYRAKAIEARKGNAYNKGYKCTPEQVENRKRNARIVHAKRMFGGNWVSAYRDRYPECAADVDGMEQ